MSSGPRAAVKAHRGLVPEKRKRDDIVRLRPITPNTAPPAMHLFASVNLIRITLLRDRMETPMQEIHLRPIDVSRQISSFSGGNHHKAIIGRWLVAGTAFFLFWEHTIRIDVGAKPEIHVRIEHLAKEGKAVLFVSCERPEVIQLADRVRVRREFRIRSILEAVMLVAAAACAF